MKFLIPALFLLTACAVVVHPTGGDKDVTPPAAKRVFPDSNTSHFDEKEIRIYFDEYVELKDANGIILSPPPRIKPKTEIVGKSLIVKFKEPLRDSTTYTLQLINAVHDVNEKNVLPIYTLSFSTGDQIDTNSLSGTVSDNYTGSPASGYTVALFHPDVTYYPDSLVYPLYISKTNESGNFTLSSIKAGSYTLYAFNDINSNLRYETGENFAFHPVPVSANDSVDLFSAQYGKPQKAIAFTPIGKDTRSFLLPIKKPDGGKIELISMTERYDKSQILYIQPIHADTLLVVDFVKDATDTTESYQFLYNEEIMDTIQVHFSNVAPNYSLSGETKTVIPGKPFLVKTNQPIRNVRPEKIQLLENDSIPIPSAFLSDHFSIHFSFEALDKGHYFLVLYDSAIHFFDGTYSKTDTLAFNTDSRNNFSNVAILFSNTQNRPYRVELLKKFDAKPDFTLETTTDSVFFSNIPAGEYHIRLVQIDPKSSPDQVVPFYQMPSKVYVHASKINLRGGWTINDFVIHNKEE